MRYLTFHNTHNMIDYMERFDAHINIITNQTYLKEIFNLYVMCFDDKNPDFDQSEGAYFREFKKAYYQLLFDR